VREAEGERGRGREIERERVSLFLVPSLGSAFLSFLVLTYMVHCAALGCVRILRAEGGGRAEQTERISCGGREEDERGRKRGERDGKERVRGKERERGK